MTLHTGFANGRRRAPVPTFLGTAPKKTATASSFTFSAQSLGQTIQEGSLLVLAVTSEAPSANRNFNGCTVDGNAATQVVASPNGHTLVAIYQYVVPAGGLSAPTIVLSTNGSGGGCTMEMFNIVGLNSNTPIDTFVNSSVVSSSPTDPLATTDGAAAIAVALNNVSGSATWTGLDEVSDYTTAVIGGHTATAAMRGGLSAGTQTVSVAFAASTSQARMAAASWR
ncbi:hypothetical protein [Kaistia sp. MMO-174]|uniref:hypothetical protein n=1 Tax=Kaistia sp. MMO-174 TaxID=3081256 RepID=UPI0030168CA3